MGERFQKIKETVLGFFKSLDKKQKIYIGLVLLFLIIVVAAIMLVTRPTYVPLATELEFSEMSKIVDKLKELNIEYKDNGTNNIFVPTKDLTRAKMAIAVDLGISKPDYSWTDYLNNTSFTVTDEMRTQQKRLATATAIARGIEEYIEGVKKANVQLYIAEKSNFVLEESGESSASVVLVLEDNFSFNKGQIDGLVNFIMNAIENLPKENITIIDQTGKPLNNFSNETDAFIASTNYEQKTMIQKELSNNIRDFLSAIYGRNHVRVMANVELNFDDFSSTERVYKPPVEGETTGMVRSINEISEKVSNKKSAEGPPGTDSNTDVTDYPAGDDASGNFEKVSKTINYEMNEIVTVLSKAKGEIKEVNISVIVDTEILEDNEMTDDMKKEVISLISTAAGVDVGRVQVSAIKFTENELGLTLYDSNSETEKPGIPLTLLFIIVGVIAVIVILVVVLMRKKARKAKEEEIKMLQEQEEAKRKAELEEIKISQEDSSSPKYQIEKFIDSKPEAVANLLRAWMTEN